jgi:hypothetical protein
VNDFIDNEHALLTGVVLGTLRRAGVHSHLMLNSVEDPTPYIKLTLEDNIEVVIVVLSPE